MKAHDPIWTILAWTFLGPVACWAVLMLIFSVAEWIVK